MIGEFWEGWVKGREQLVGCSVVVSVDERVEGYWASGGRGGEEGWSAIFNSDFTPLISSASLSGSF